METSRDLTVSFYDDYGTLSVYAKRSDTQRTIEFNFVDNSILSDRTNLHVYIRGQSSNGYIIPPFEIDSSQITDETITFNIPKAFLRWSGIVKCDLLFVKGVSHIDENTGEIDVENESEILSTHNFNIYVEELPIDGGVYDPETQEEIDILQELIDEAQTVLADLNNYEDKINTAYYWQPI